MKLYRFTASNNQKAIMKVHAALGLNALIYETRKSDEGVEILAALSDDQLIKSGKELSPENLSSENILFESTLANNVLIEQLQSQIKMMDDNIQKLIDHINVLNAVVTKPKIPKKIRWNPFKKIIRFRKSPTGEIYDKPAAI